MHIAIKSENIELIHKLSLLDCDNNKLRWQKNIQGKTPLDLMQPYHEDIVLTIWDRIKQGNI